MADFDINQALLVYLGGAQDSPGIQPATMQKRLVEFAGDQLDEIKPAVDRYLERTAKLRFKNWPDTPAEVADHVANRLAEEMPELSTNVHQKLASYFTYSNR